MHINMNCNNDNDKTKTMIIESTESISNIIEGNKIEQVWPRHTWLYKVMKIVCRSRYITEPIWSWILTDKHKRWIDSIEMGFVWKVEKKKNRKNTIWGEIIKNNLWHESSAKIMP